MVRLLPSISILLITLLIAAWSMAMNQGHFIYAMDDPYIHLDLADIFWRTGVYGVNAGEVSSPSSSIIWPLFLSIGVGTVWHVYVPLLLNLLFAALTTLAIYDVLALALKNLRPLQVAGLTLLLALGLNLPGLALTGMEHGLQIYLAVLLALGLIRFHTSGQVPGWLWLTIILGPLVRYENVITSGLALAILAHQGQFKRAFITGTILALLLTSFSAFLLALGLDWLPNSTLVKRLRPNGEFWLYWWVTIRNVANNPIAWLMLIASFLGIASTCLKTDWRNLRWFATAGLVAAMVAHLFIGRFSVVHNYMRYEYYLLGFTLLYGVWLWQSSLPKPLHLILSALAFAALTPGLYYSLYAAPHASAAIYLQQEQMRRFAQEFWQQPIAVNDIGLVGYQNPHNVLDIFGLANPITRDKWRLGWTTEPLALDTYIRTQQVDVIAIYPTWFSPAMRANWTVLGTLTRPPVFAGNAPLDQVMFLTPHQDKAPAIRAVLEKWAATLPPQATFTLAQ